jgi:hypothetical protein
LCPPGSVVPPISFMMNPPSHADPTTMSKGIICWINVP